MKAALIVINSAAAVGLACNAALLFTLADYTRAGRIVDERAGQAAAIYCVSLIPPLLATAQGSKRYQQAFVVYLLVTQTTAIFIASLMHQRYIVRPPSWFVLHVVAAGLVAWVAAWLWARQRRSP